LKTRQYVFFVNLEQQENKANLYQTQDQWLEYRFQLSRDSDKDLIGAKELKAIRLIPIWQ
jgi:hypothetical protein